MMPMMTTCKEITEYIENVRNSEYPICRDQLALCDYIEKCFGEEPIYVDEQQLKRYLNHQKYFPYKLLPWERFVFALHNCTYKSPGVLRWPILLILVGRGAGKNGYVSFETFCWITPANGVRKYHVDIFATAEDQAKTSFDDVYDVLEENRAKLERYFYWNKEAIINLKTGSKLRFRTSGAKTKDGGRPGAIVFDEYHAYEGYKLVEVAKTGLGKKPMPRQTIITTDGDVRGGPLDDIKARADQILHGIVSDNGMLPFICRLDSADEVDDPRMWHKANPSLRYFPTLHQQLEQEYGDYKINPSGNSAFMVKRMNLPKTFDDESVTDWNNIIAAKHTLPDLKGCPCIAGIDYMKTTDFLSAGLLFKYKGFYCWMQHTWVCRESADLSRITAPLKEWEDKGYLTFCDGPEISPDVPAAWVADQAEIYGVTLLGMDNFRFTLMKRALREEGFDTDKGGANNIMLTKRVTENRYVPVITSLFNTQRIWWGDDPMMGWYTNNTSVVTEKGNQYYGKKEEKSRKTDGFKAMVAAICASEDLEDCGEETNYGLIHAYTY